MHNAGPAPEPDGALVPAARAPDIARYCDPLMEGDSQRVQRPDRMHETICDLPVRQRLNKRAEKAVPEDDHAPVVPVQVLGIRSVMHPMMCRSIQDPLERAEPSDEIGVQPELIHEIDAQHGANGQGIQAENVQRQKEDPSA